MSPKTQISHVIFDLDGTLIDSIKIYKEALSLVLEDFGKTVTWELMSKSAQKHDFLEAMGVIFDELDLNHCSEEVIRTYSKVRDNLMSQTQLMPGVPNVLNHFKMRGIPMAICSAISSEFWPKATSHFDPIFRPGHYFETITTAKDDPEVKFNKPHPDPYHVTIRRLRGNPHPSQVLVFEDMKAGVESALAAGANVVMVCDQRLKTQPVDGVRYINSFEDFNPDLFQFVGCK